MGKEYEVPTCPGGNGVGVTMLSGLPVAELMSNAGVLVLDVANRGAGAVALAVVMVLTGPNRLFTVEVPTAGIPARGEAT